MPREASMPNLSASRKPGVRRWPMRCRIAPMPAESSGSSCCGPMAADLRLLRRGFRWAWQRNLAFRPHRPGSGCSAACYSPEPGTPPTAPCATRSGVPYSAISARPWPQHLSLRGTWRRRMSLCRSRGGGKWAARAGNPVRCRHCSM